MSASPGQRNPYRPGAALSPLHLAGRGKELRRFESVLGSAPELPANVRLTGLRGVGKTVLLKEFERRAVEELGWLASRVQIEPGDNTDAGIVRVVSRSCERAIRQASRTARVRATVKGAVDAARGLVKVKYEDLEFSFGGSSENGSTTIGLSLFDAATAADRNDYGGYLLMLDEAQLLRDGKQPGDDHPLSSLIAAVNTLQEAEIPIGLVLCGLPTLKANLLKARTYTERMFRGEEIGRLLAPPQGDDAVEAFVKPLEATSITATDALVQRVVTEVEGYPYFIQLWGGELWEAAAQAGIDELTEQLLDQVEPDIYRRLDIDFYEPRVESLTPAEQDLLIATAKCPYPPLRSADIRGRSQKSDGNVNVLMGRLVDQGVIYRTQKGIYEYTAPKFHEFIKRRAARLDDSLN